MLKLLPVENFLAKYWVFLQKKDTLISPIQFQQNIKYALQSKQDVELEQSDTKIYMVTWLYLYITIYSFLGIIHPHRFP